MTELRKISLADKFASFDERWSPKTLAVVGDYAVKAVKIEGEFVWRSAFSSLGAKAKAEL